MGNFTGVQINKAHGGLVRSTSAADRVLLLVVGASAIAASLEHYVPVKLASIYDLEARGVTATTDTANHELLHHHVEEVFRLSPDMELNLMIVPPAQTVSALVANETFIAAIRGIEGVNTIGICGIAADATLQTAVQAAQLLVDNFAADHLYIDAVVLEGLGTYIPNLADMPDLRTMEAENVSVVIAQDPAIAALDAANAGYASVGSYMGMLSVRRVHENVGSVDIEIHPSTAKGTKDYPLTAKLLGRWLSASLSNGVSMSEVSVTMQKALTAKGYNFAGGFQGYAGIFFSNSCTCTDADSDYAYIERNAVWNKAARLIRSTLLPRVRSKVKADPATGYISDVTIADWSARVNAAMETMVAADDIADFDTYINPNQLAVSADPFAVQVKMVADGIVHEFEVDLGFTNKIA